MYEKSQVYAKSAFLRTEIQDAENGQGNVGCTNPHLSE